MLSNCMYFACDHSVSNKFYISYIFVDISAIFTEAILESHQKLSRESKSLDNTCNQNEQHCEWNDKWSG